MKRKDLPRALVLGLLAMLINRASLLIRIANCQFWQTDLGYWTDYDVPDSD